MKILFSPLKQSILDAIEHLFARYLDILPLFLAAARPIYVEWNINPYFGVFPLVLSALRERDREREEEGGVLSITLNSNREIDSQNLNKKDRLKCMSKSKDQTYHYPYSVT